MNYNPGRVCPRILEIISISAIIHTKLKIMDVLVHQGLDIGTNNLKKYHIFY